MTSPDDAFQTACRHYAAGDLAAAAQGFARAEGSLRHGRRASYNLGMACQQLGRWEEALESFQRAAAAGPWKDALLRAGTMQFRLGRPEAAIPDLERAAALDPGCLLTQQALETALILTDRPDHAATAIERNRTFHQRCVDAALSGGRLAEAEEILGRDIEVPASRQIYGIAAGDDRFQATRSHRFTETPERRAVLQAGVVEPARRGLAGLAVAPPHRPAGAACRFVGLIMARDEAARIETNIRHHLDIGLDHIIVTDNRSADDTLERLRALQQSLPVTVMTEPGRSYRQGIWTTRMGYYARDVLGAEWLVPIDCDELLVPGRGSLGGVVDDATAVYGASLNLLLLPLHGVVPDADQAFGERPRAPWAGRMLRRPLKRPLYSYMLMAGHAFHVVSHKAMVRAADLVCLLAGNHRAIMNRPHYGFTNDLAIRHDQIGLYEHWQRKILRIEESQAHYQEPTRAYHELAGMAARGHFRDVFRSWAYPTAFWTEMERRGHLDPPVSSWPAGASYGR